MERQYIEKWFSNRGSRNDVRKRIIACFMEEEPGMGAGNDSSKYTYYVETLADGNRVYLTRPAFLNRGFDFVIRVENADYGHKGSYKNVPTHKDISVDLEAKKKENPDMTKAELKKANQQALSAARTSVGAKRTSVEITDKEWEAIQAGAISENKLIQILNNANIDTVRQRATPRTTSSLSTAKVSRISAMRASGYTTAEIADALGVSTSTVSKYLNERG